MKVLSPVIGRLEQRRRRNILLHESPARGPRALGGVMPYKTESAEDVEIAERLLQAWDEPAWRSERVDLWTEIREGQDGFRTVLASKDPVRLARYLCNVARHEASRGITQGDLEYDRIVRDASYRDFILLMTKDKLVALAEALGVIPVENPEQGPWGENLGRDADELVTAISNRLGVDIAPPDVDGGLLKLKTGRGDFGERDFNAIFTAQLVRSLVGERRRICEIGGGSGRVAYWSVRMGASAYTLVDLPHVNVVQGYYLMKALGADVVGLYGEAETPKHIVRIRPAHALGELEATEFDLVLNQDSFPEMHPDTVTDYLSWVAAGRGPRLLSINHESRPTYGGGRRQISVAQMAGECHGLERRERFPYWLRKGYVVELYSPTD